MGRAERVFRPTDDVLEYQMKEDLVSSCSAVDTRGSSLDDQQAVSREDFLQLVRRIDEMRDELSLAKERAETSEEAIRQANERAEKAEEAIRQANERAKKAETDLQNERMIAIMTSPTSRSSAFRALEASAIENYHGEDVETVLRGVSHASEEDYERAWVALMASDPVLPTKTPDSNTRAWERHNMHPFVRQILQCAYRGGRRADQTLELDLIYEGTLEDETEPDFAFKFSRDHRLSFDSLVMPVEVKNPGDVVSAAKQAIQYASARAAHLRNLLVDVDSDEPFHVFGVGTDGSKVIFVRVDMAVNPVSYVLHRSAPLPLFPYETKDGERPLTIGFKHLVNLVRGDLPALGFVNGPRFYPKSVGDVSLGQRLGRGGWANVFAVEGREDVVVKIPRMESAKSQILVERRILAKLPEHPNLPSIIDHIDPHDSSFLAFTPRGYPLQDIFERVKSTPDQPVFARRVANDVLQALRSAHENKIIHCDVRPSNVVWVGEYPEGRAVLIDWGLAQYYKHNKGRWGQGVDMQGIIGVCHFVHDDLLTRRWRVQPPVDLASVTYMYATIAHSTNFHNPPWVPRIVEAHQEHPIGDMYETLQEIRQEWVTSCGDEMLQRFHARIPATSESVPDDLYTYFQVPTA